MKMMSDLDYFLLVLRSKSADDMPAKLPFVQNPKIGAHAGKQVKKMKGIDDVKTAIMLNKVFIDYDPSLVDSAAIRKAIDKTGYKSYMSVEEKRKKMKT